MHAWDAACFQKDGLEADDLIAAVTARALGEGWRVVIVSADKDLMQLVRDDDDRVVLWDSMRDRVYGPREVREKLGVAPSHVRDFLALTGDTSDNVPGVPGVGPKTATDLLGQFGTLEGIYAQPRRGRRSRSSARACTHARGRRAHLAEARHARRDRAARVGPRQARSGAGRTSTKLRRLYTELEFNRQLDQLDAARTRRARGTAAATERHDRSQALGTPVDALRRDRVSPACSTAGLERSSREARERGQIGHRASGDERLTRCARRSSGFALASEPGRGHYVPLAAPLPRLAAAALRGRACGRSSRRSSPTRSVTNVGHDVKQASIVLARAGAAARRARPSTRTSRRTSSIPSRRTAEGARAARARRLASPRFEESLPKTRGPADDLRGARRRARDELRRVPTPRLPSRCAPRFEPRLAAEGLDAADARRRDAARARARARWRCAASSWTCRRSRSFGKTVDEQLRDLESECKRVAGRDFVLRSRDQLEKILFDELKLPVVKRTPKGGRSTDADVLEALADKHELPKAAPRATASSTS